MNAVGAIAVEVAGAPSRSPWIPLIDQKTEATSGSILYIRKQHIILEISSRIHKEDMSLRAMQRLRVNDEVLLASEFLDARC